MVADQNSDAQPVTSKQSLDSQIDDASPEVLVAAAADAGFTEDLALALLKRADIQPHELEKLAKNKNVLKFREAKLALIAHPKTPRHASVPFIRQLYLFDLMQVALIPTVPADIRKAADDALLLRLETVTLGERLALARRASGRIAAVLLSDKEPRVMQAALQNPRLTEAALIRSILRPDSTATLIDAVGRNAKWSARQQVRLLLIRP